MRIIDADRYRKDLLSAYDDISMEFEVLDRQPLVSAIPIPEGATNGDVIMAMFGCTVIEISNSKVYVEHIYFPFDEEWWNAPYKWVIE